MAKNKTLQNLIVLFVFLFSLINSEPDWMYYDYSQGYVEKEYTGGEKERTYSLQFSNAKQVPYYIKIEVNSTDNGPAPLLCFSNNDESCSTRENLAKNAAGNSVIMWVKREQFMDEKLEFYAKVECAEAGCKYKIRFTGDQSASFSPNFVYSYLVTTDTKEMRFDILGADSNTYMTVFLEGSRKATIDIENEYEEVLDLDTGKAMIFWIPGEDEGDDTEEEEEEVNYKPLKATSIATINVKNAEVGDYVTISVHLVNDNEYEYLGVGPKDYALPNGPEVSGFLQTGILNEECFPFDFSDSRYRSMNKIYITGRVQTKYGWFFLEDEHRNYREDTDVEIFDGQLSFVMQNNNKLNYICFELPFEESIKQPNMAFTFSLTEPTTLKELYNYFPPQMSGVIYRRLIPKGTVAFFSGGKNDNSAKKYDYNLYQIKGLSKLYISECRNYPDCHYSKDALFNLVQPKNTNQMTIWTTTEDKSSAIGNNKYVMVVYCEDDDNKGNGYCEFETSIFSKGQDVVLVENEKFSRYAIKGEKGNFVADLKSARKVQRITFDVMIFSGDVNFRFGGGDVSLKADKEEDIDLDFQGYYLSNKIHFYANLAQIEVDKVVINFEAQTNSFFTVQFNVNSYNLVQTEEIVPSGENYLVQIDPTSPTKTKKIFLQNFRYKNKNPFLANFFALNCEFEVKRGNEVFNFYDGYAQEVLTTTSSGYASDSYEYSIKITDADLSNYNHKMCMIYVSGIEAEKEDDSRGIVIGENINNQIIFEKGLSRINFVYPLADSSHDLALYLNIVDKAYYKLTVLVGEQTIKTETVTRTQIFYIRGSIISLHCEANRVCPINIKVEYTKPITKTDPMIEVTLREIKNTPTYLQKGQAKRDFVCGDKYYYLYTEVGKNEEGEITINFLREFGSIWAKIVRKDQTYSEEDANWRGLYRMPSKEWDDSLPFNSYTKTMKINPEDTQDCIEGCYLLLSIQISQIGDYVDDSKFYPFSIITRVNPSNRAYTDIPKVVIQVDEFIIGNVEVSENERISQFYEVWLPHDDEAVIFDWQSSVAGLYINLGGTRPTTRNAHFKLLPSGRDSILKLTKKEILDMAQAKKIDIPASGSVQDVNLVIGIWTDKSDSINTELYSLRIHQVSDAVDQLDITEVNTDQKILCQPTARSDGYYRCLFMVIYDDNDVDLSTPILAYSESTSKGAMNYMYADFIDRKIYDEYQENELTKAIPTYETAALNGRADGVDYIYVSKLEEQKYLYINVITDEPEDLMIVTSMPVYNYLAYDLFEFNPNPYTEQLLSCSGETLRLVFPGSKSVMVNLITLNGHAEVFWKNDSSTVFNLRGAGDRLSISSGENIDQLIIKKRAEEKKLTTMEDPGFAFYISYHERDPKINFDEIDYGKSIEIGYKDTDLPIIIYSKILDQYRDINVAITFRDNEVDDFGEYHSTPLFVSAQMVRESVIYIAKKDPELAPPFERGIVGNYDPALKTAQVFLSEDTIEQFGIKPEDNPSLYISVEKSTEFKDDVFKKFSVEAQVSGVNDGVIPVEKVYHYGRVRGTAWGFSVYRLKADKNRPFLRVQVAFNSENLDFFITDSDESRQNCTFHKVEKARGKVSITIKKGENVEIYNLIIFKRSRTITETYLNNYAFKYINAKSEDELFDYPILNSADISYVQTKEGELDIIKCTFNKLDIQPGQANVTYFFKIVDNALYIEGEDINTVAVTESGFYTSYKRNPIDDNGKITLTAQGSLSNWVFLNVIAQVQQNNVLEYVAYNGIKTYRPPANDKGTSQSSNNTGVFIAVGVFLLLIVIGLVAAIIIFQMKNKKLLNQVKQVSFQKTNSNTDPMLQSQNNINN